MNSYETFKKNIDHLINIDLNSYKEKQMKRRITSLRNRNRYDSFHEYFLRLKKDKILLNEFINHLTINVSEFYRNPPQWKVLEQNILPMIIDSLKKPLKVWSSACSTGEEPYSLVMLLTKFYDIDNIKVIASDIDDEAIEKAKIGLYNEKALINLPLNFKKNFFNKTNNEFQIVDEIKKRVKFKKIDLLKDAFPDDIDIITCRNVMIYFTEQAKQVLYNKFYDSLSDKGVFFVGSTEQIISPGKYNLQSIGTFFYSKLD